VGEGGAGLGGWGAGAKEGAEGRSLAQDGPVLRQEEQQQGGPQEGQMEGQTQGQTQEQGQKQNQGSSQGAGQPSAGSTASISVPASTPVSALLPAAPGVPQVATGVPRVAVLENVFVDRRGHVFNATHRLPFGACEGTHAEPLKVHPSAASSPQEPLPRPRPPS